MSSFRHYFKLSPFLENFRGWFLVLYLTLLLFSFNSQQGQKEHDQAPAEDQWSFALEQLFAEPLEVRPAEADEDHVMKILHWPPGASEEKEKKEAAEQEPGQNPSAITAVIRGFFESLTAEYVISFSSYTLVHI